MTRTRTRRLLLATAGGCLAAAVLLAILTFANIDAGSTTTVRFGWTVPFLTAVALAALTWTLSVGPRRPEIMEPRLRARFCSSCGKTVMGEWRMCPYCGRMLESIPGVPTDVTADLS